MKMESNSSRVSPSNSWTTTFKSQSSWCRIIVVGDLHGHFSVRLPSARPLINRVVQYIKSSTGYKMLLQMLHQNGTTGSKWYMHHLYGTSPIPFSGSFGRTWCISSRSMENLKLAPVALSRRLGIFSLEDDTWWHCAGCVRIGNMWLAKLWGDFHATRIYQVPFCSAQVYLQRGFRWSRRGFLRSLGEKWRAVKIAGNRGMGSRSAPGHLLLEDSVSLGETPQKTTLSGDEGWRGWRFHALLCLISYPLAGWVWIRCASHAAQSLYIYYMYIYTYCATYMDISGLLAV